MVATALFLVVGYHSPLTHGHQIAILPEILAKLPMANKTVKGDLLLEPSLSVHSDLKVNLTRTPDIIYFSPVWLVAKFQYEPRPQRCIKPSAMETSNTNQTLTNYERRIPMSAWAEDDIPSNKLLLKGSASLSNAELLSIIIGNGIEGENSLDIAMKTLAQCGNNLCEFWRLGVTELQQIKGIGPKRAVQIVAMFALARRRNESEVILKDKIKSSTDAFRIFHSIIGDLPYEEFWVLMLNRANKVIKKVRISEGGISGTVVDPKKVFKFALELHASSIILGHNHPSGLITPSEADIKITKKLVDAGKLLEIAVLDHLIIGQDQFYSFADEGSL